MGGGSGRDPFFHDKSLAKTKAFPVVVSMLCPRRAVWAWTLPLGMAVTLVLSVPQIDLMPHDLVTQLLRVLAIETKQEKALVHADPTELTLSGLEAFSFDYVVKWPLSLIINRWAPVPGALASAGSCLGLSGRKGRACALSRGLPAPVVPYGVSDGLAGRAQNRASGLAARSLSGASDHSQLPPCAPQEGPDPLPDAVPAPVLLQARGAAAVQRLGQQQNRQATLAALRPVVRPCPPPAPPAAVW